MTDFGELCPLFETGVYKEVTFPGIRQVSGVSVTANLLEGTVSAGAGALSAFSFGRTVVVTDAFIQRYATAKAAENLYLGHRTTAAAAATAFGTATITTTLDVYTEWTWQAMTTASTTFTASEVLNLSLGTVTATFNGNYSLIVRYREK